MKQLYEVHASYKMYKTRVLEDLELTNKVYLRKPSKWEGTKYKNNYKYKVCVFSKLNRKEANHLCNQLRKIKRVKAIKYLQYDPF